MKRLSIILATIAVTFSLATVSADTHLWLTTEGSGVEVTTGDSHRLPPPPPHRHGHHHYKQCKICKKHYKEMRKAAKKHDKEMRKAYKKHNKHHRR